MDLWLGVKELFTNNQGSEWRPCQEMNLLQMEPVFFPFILEKISGNKPH